MKIDFCENQGVEYPFYTSRDENFFRAPSTLKILQKLVQFLIQKPLKPSPMSLFAQPVSPRENFKI